MSSDALAPPDVEPHAPGRTAVPAPRPTPARRWSPLRLTLVLGGAVVAGIVLLILPSLINPYRLFLASLTLVFATSAVGLTILMGWSGQIGLAHAGFFGIGAYGTTYLFDQGVPWVLAVLVSALAAAAVGAAIGFPATRLRGFYLAIATLAFAELMVRVFIEAEGVTGGIAGKSVELIQLGGLDIAASHWYLALFTATLVFVFAWRVSCTSIGRALRAVRDAEIATGALALPANRYKLLAFAMSAFVGALAGAIFSQLQSFLTPEIFGMGLLIQFLVMSFVGGVTYLVGALLGAGFVVAARELLQDLGAWQRLAYGIALILVVRFLPRGVASLPGRLRRRVERETDTKTETEAA